MIGMQSYSTYNFGDIETIKGELRPEISLLHMKALTLIKAKSNVFLFQNIHD